MTGDYCWNYLTTRRDEAVMISHWLWGKLKQSAVCDRIIVESVCWRWNPNQKAVQQPLLSFDGNEWMNHSLVDTKQPEKDNQSTDMCFLRKWTHKTWWFRRGETTESPHSATTDPPPTGPWPQCSFDNYSKSDFTYESSTRTYIVMNDDDALSKLVYSLFVNGQGSIGEILYLDCSQEEQHA